MCPFPSSNVQKWKGKRHRVNQEINWYSSAITILEQNSNACACTQAGFNLIAVRNSHQINVYGLSFSNIQTQLQTNKGKDFQEKIQVGDHDSGVYFHDS